MNDRLEQSATMRSTEPVRDFFERNLSMLDGIASFPFEEREAYLEFLAQTRHYVAHTTRVLALAASRLGPDREALHARFLRHALEELGHHTLAERDAKKLGEDVLARPELPTTAALYQSQYFVVERLAAPILLGHVVALEGLSCRHGPAVHERVKRAHGALAASFIRVHADADVDHVEKAILAVEQLPPAEQVGAQKNFVDTCVLYTGFLDAILERVRQAE